MSGSMSARVAASPEQPRGNLVDTVVHRLADVVRALESRQVHMDRKLADLDGQVLGLTDQHSEQAARPSRFIVAGAMRHRRPPIFVLLARAALRGAPSLQRADLLAAEFVSVPLHTLRRSWPYRSLTATGAHWESCAFPSRPVSIRAQLPSVVALFSAFCAKALLCVIAAWIAGVQRGRCRNVRGGPTPPCVVDPCFFRGRRWMLCCFGPQPPACSMPLFAVKFRARQVRAATVRLAQALRALRFVGGCGGSQE